MDKLIEAFGIDWKIILAQLINFAILVFLLYKIGYKPIINFVQNRRNEIEAGVKNAEEAKESLHHAQQQSDKIISETHKNAQEIINKAREQASKQAQELTDHHRQELKQMSDAAKLELAAERERMMRETREQAGTLVLSVAEKLIGEKMDATRDAEYVKKMLAES